jgi:Anti-sigma factor NepR
MSLIENQAYNDMQNGKKKPPKLDDLAVSQIGKKLRAQFDEILNEQVPDRFLDLLNQLDAAEKKSPKDDADE